MIRAAWAGTGFLVGAALAALWVRARSGAHLARLEASLEAAERERREGAETTAALRSELEGERRARAVAETRWEEAGTRLAEERKTLEEARGQLEASFKALAGTALGEASETFLRLAGQTMATALASAKGEWGEREEAVRGVVQPLTEALQRFEGQVQQVEARRMQEEGGLREQVEALARALPALQRETTVLSTALRSSQVRGQWGEMALRKAVELAGLLDFCEFQKSLEGGQRPDLIVSLPGGRHVVVDAKAVGGAYLDALSATSDEARREFLEQHAAQVRSRVNELSAKAYWEALPQATEFVVMFLPVEAFFSAAVEADRTLVEDSAVKNVFLATPTMLIALLRLVGEVWRQDRMARNVKEAERAARELYDRLAVFLGHVERIRKALQGAGGAFDEAVGSLEQRVLPAARRMRELGVADKELPAVRRADLTLRPLVVPELEGGEGRPAPGS